MPKASPRHRMRYALSCLEMARDAEDARQTRRAKVLVQRLRREFLREAERADRRLHATLVGQDELLERARYGKVDAARANAMNRELLARASALRSTKEELEAVLNAGSSQVLGSAIDEPFEVCYRRAEATPLIEWKPTPMGFCIWFVALTVSVVGSLLYLGVFSLFSRPMLDASRLGQAGKRIEVVCANPGKREVGIYVPIPEGVWTTGRSSDRAVAYGLAVAVAEREGDPLREIASPPRCWRYLGSPIIDPAAITVEPESRVRLVFDVEELRKTVADLHSVKFLLKSRAGDVVREAEAPIL